VAACSWVVVPIARTSDLSGWNFGLVRVELRTCQGKDISCEQFKKGF